MKMKKKYALPRKTLATKRWVICICLLLIVSLCGNFGLTPRAALKETEEYYGTGKTDIIIPFHRNENIKFTGIGRFCLSANDEAIISMCAKYHVQLGWYRAVTSVVDRDRSLPVDVGYHSISGSKGGEALYYYGIINDEGVERIEIGWDTDFDEKIDYTLPYHIFEKDGLRYIYQGFVPEDEAVYLKPTVLCYDMDGELIYKGDVIYGSSSSIG